MKFNARAKSIPLSVTLALDARAKELIADGRDVINMTAGEPDFDAPAAVRDAARAYVDSGKVRYTPAPGRPSLRETMARWQMLVSTTTRVTKTWEILVMEGTLKWSQR